MGHVENRESGGQVVEPVHSSGFSGESTPRCGGTPANVQVPTSLKVVSVNVLNTGNSGDHGCLAGFYGIQIDIKYQVLDGSTPPKSINDATMTPTEHVVFHDGSTKDGNIGPTNISTPTAKTRSDGHIFILIRLRCGNKRVF
jgi:hypothetical protein